MEVDARPAPPLQGARHPHYPQHQHHDHHHHHHHQPLHVVEANRQILPPPTARSPTTPLPSHALLQKSPSNYPLPSPAVKPVHHPHHAQASPKEAALAVSSRPRDFAPPSSHSHSPAEHRTNGHGYPRSPQDVQIDAIERLQTQISQNSSALVAQSRDMRHYEDSVQRQEDSLRQEFQVQFRHHNGEIGRVDEAVGRLQHEMRDIHALLKSLSIEVRSGNRGAAGPPQSISAQDSALELMAQQVAVISHRTNEIDTLKITIEIMKNKIQRLEDVASAVPPRPAAPLQTVPREPPQLESQDRTNKPSQTVSAYNTNSPAVPHANIPAHNVPKLQTYHSQGSHTVASTPDAPQRLESAQSQSGWATVNAGTKRTLSSGMNSPQDSIAQPLDSSKRPKLAPIEPRAAHAGSHGLPGVYEYMDTDDSESARVQTTTHTHTLPSQPQSTRAAVESTLPSQPSHAGFVTYGTQDAPSDDSWRPESQRIVQVRTPRGRGRGGGPGSRGGRVRKSLQAQPHPLETPEWEKHDWQSVSGSQVSPDGYYAVARSPRGIVRRGSGGGGGGSSRGGRPPSSHGSPGSSQHDRAISLGLQGVTAGIGIGLPMDPYAHTKKTRSKPIRNADGVLIRKDGRPDMRSQSSAANLRKVHARKEDGTSPDRGSTPTHPQHSMSAGAETPIPTEYGSAGHDVSASVQRKHSHIISKMFPDGVEESRQEHDYAHRVFEDDQDHTAHPRIQHHHHDQNPNGAARPREIKREHFEDRPAHEDRQHYEEHRAHETRQHYEEHEAADTQTPEDGDVAMDHSPEDHADEGEQTPGGETETPGCEVEYYQAEHREEERAQLERTKEPTQAAQSSAQSPQTLAASSTQAS